MNVRTLMDRITPDIESSRARLALLTPSQVKHLKIAASAVLVFGILASLAANVAHSLERPDFHDIATWKAYGGLVLAGLPPLALFACIELVVRIPTHSRVLGPARIAVTLVIGGFAGWVSYGHMFDVAIMMGESSTAAAIYPLIIDGMMLVATISAIELGRVGVAVRTIAEEVAAEQSGARKCAEGCTCGRHARKPVAPPAVVKPVRKRTTVKAPTASPTSPAPVGA